jgi:rod shape-determining protein MreC
MGACLILSLALMTIDHRTIYLNLARSHLAALVSPLYHVIHFPVSMVQWLSESVSERVVLLQDNRTLRHKNLELQARLQRFHDLQRENERLRTLLGATPQAHERLMIAQVLAVDLSPHTRKLVVDKGVRHGVREGLPVLDGEGILGQVLHVHPFSSVIMLITDPNHMLPVQIVRTGVRTLAEGTGSGDRLSLLYLPRTAELQLGDVLISSGLGGKFPPGYPVGEIHEIEPRTGEAYTHAAVTPFARLDRNREVLLLWPSQEPNPEITVPVLESE